MVWRLHLSRFSPNAPLFDEDPELQVLMFKLEFFVAGKVQAKQRARKGRGGHWYTPHETLNYEKLVATTAGLAMKGKKITGDYLDVDVHITHDIPKSWRKSKRQEALDCKVYPSKSDTDNKIKCLFDGMNKIVYFDDRQIVRFSVFVKYGVEPGANISIGSLSV